MTVSFCLVAGGLIVYGAARQPDPEPSPGDYLGVCAVVSERGHTITRTEDRRCVSWERRPGYEIRPIWYRVTESVTLPVVGDHIGRAGAYYAVPAGSTLRTGAPERGRLTIVEAWDKATGTGGDFRG